MRDAMLKNEYEAQKALKSRHKRLSIAYSIAGLSLSTQAVLDTTRKACQEKFSLEFISTLIAERETFLRTESV